MSGGRAPSTETATAPQKNNNAESFDKDSSRHLIGSRSHVSALGFVARGATQQRNKTGRSNNRKAVVPF